MAPDEADELPDHDTNRRHLQRGGPVVSCNKSKKAPKGDYAVGYARPPKANQFQPGQSGNLGGRPSLDELLLEEAARAVKFQAATRSCTWIGTAH